MLEGSHTLDSTSVPTAPLPLRGPWLLHGQALGSGQQARTTRPARQLRHIPPEADFQNQEFLGSLLGLSKLRCFLVDGPEQQHRYSKAAFSRPDHLSTGRPPNLPLNAVVFLQSGCEVLFHFDSGFTVNHTSQRG